VAHASTVQFNFEKAVGRDVEPSFDGIADDHELAPQKRRPA
jgi:hypothetical protein